MNTQRFDHLWQAVHKQYSLMVKHANGVRSTVRMFRRAAYRFASALIQIQEHHHNEFVDHVLSSKMDIDAWLDEHFGPIEQMGDDRKRLMAAIKEGMTENEYVEEGAIWLVKRKVKSPAVVARADLDRPIITETQTIEEQVVSLSASWAAAKAENRELRRSLGIALREIDALHKAVGRAERLLVNVSKRAG